VKKVTNDRSGPFYVAGRSGYPKLCGRDISSPQRIKELGNISMIGDIKLLDIHFPNALLVNFLPAGMGLIASLASNININVPILAHLDFGGAFYASPWHGISSSLLYGKLARIAGVDLLCIPTPYGKFSLSYAKFIRMVHALRSPFHDMRNVWPIAGGAIKQGHIPKLFNCLGQDFIIGAGGAIHAHPMGSAAGARAFRQGIDLMMKYGKLEEQKLGRELKVAIEKWGSE
jgi:2,3-diketo-5-methylthiopentyl-1-phosphate enolase